MGVGVGLGAARADAGAFARRFRSSSAHRRFGGPWSWRVLTTGLLIAAVSMLVVSTVVDSSSHRLALDFRGAYLPAAHAVLDGQSPYTAPEDPVGGYVYPPQLALLLTPLTFVPEGVAVFFAVLGVAGLLVGSLAVLGVRDLRCYAAVFVWAPTWNELDMASVTAALVFALALAWRYREHAWAQAFALGLAIPAKLFLWPLLVWTLATRRYRATILAVAVGLVVTIAAWATIGFDGLLGYVALLRRLTEFEAVHGYSLSGTASHLGLSNAASYVLAIVIGSGLLGGCLMFARRGDDQRSFALATAAALALTPVLWQHYLLLLLVPLAVARPRFSVLWLLPVVLWFSPRATYDDVEKVLPLLVTAVLLLILLRPRSPEARAGRARMILEGVSLRTPEGRDSAIV